MPFLSSDVFFSEFTFSKDFFRNTIRVINSLDPGPVLRFVGSNLGPNCLPRLSAANISKRVFACGSFTLLYLIFLYENRVY